MPTIPLYMNDTYLLNHEATVTFIGTDACGPYVLLDESIFHPQGGGQPSDTGTLNEQPILKLLQVGDEIHHYVNNPDSFKVGDKVKLCVNEENRMKCAAMHSAGHVLASILKEVHGFKYQSSGHHFPGQCRVVFKTGGILPSKETLEKNMNDLIFKQHPIYPEIRDNNRVLVIPGFEPIRCGGTHISNAAELSSFNVRNIKFDKKKGEYSFGYEVKYNFDCKNEQTIDVNAANEPSESISKLTF